jgi:hypothetical protein
MYHVLKIIILFPWSLDVLLAVQLCDVVYHLAMSMLLLCMSQQLKESILSIVFEVILSWRASSCDGKPFYVLFFLVVCPFRRSQNLFP